MIQSMPVKASSREGANSISLLWLGALRKKRGKESLEDEPGCAHEGRAGLLVAEHAPAWRGVVGVFTFSISAFL